MNFTSNPTNPGSRRIALAAAVALGCSSLVTTRTAVAGDKRDACDGIDATARVAVAVARQDSGERRRRDGYNNGDGDRRDKDKDDRDGGGRDGRDGRRSYGGPFDMNWGSDGRQGEMRNPRPSEWTETQAFMYIHSPRRQQAVDQLPEGGKKESIRRFLFERYRTLQSLRKRDRAAFDQRLAQLKVEDQIFGLVSDWGAADEEQRQKLKDRLRVETANLVSLDLEERRRRVESLRRELDEQTRTLENDEKEREALVEKRLGRFVDWANRWAERKGKKDDSEKQQGPDEQQEKKPD